MPGIAIQKQSVRRANVVNRFVASLRLVQDGLLVRNRHAVTAHAELVECVKRLIKLIGLNQQRQVHAVNSFVIERRIVN